jgi:hypothetical protein
VGFACAIALSSPGEPAREREREREKRERRQFLLLKP